MVENEIPTAQTVNYRHKNAGVKSDAKGRKQYKNPHNPGGFESANDKKKINNLHIKHGDQN